MSLAAQMYLVLLGVVGLVTGAVLVARPDQTAEYFVWPIAPAATALFIGAGYLGTGITLLLTLVRARSWSEIRLFILPVAVFAALMLTATALHADRFFWDRPQTWLWVGLYGVILLGALGLTLRGQRSVNGLRAPRLSRRRATLLVIAGLLMAAWSVTLFVAPALSTVIWPWPLTPLTARVVAGWVGVGAALGLSAGLAGDTSSVRLPLLGWLVTVVLFILAGLIALPAFATDDPRTWVYFGALGASAPGVVWMLRGTESQSVVE
jgi:hypothetical protein